MALALELARRIRALSFEHLPPEAVHWAKVGILDTVGVTLAGAREEAARIVGGLAASSGASLVFGTNRRVAPLDAALVNGTAAHALDFDDCNNTLGGHPSAPILPALFALADETGASGCGFLAAYIAGFEVECKIAKGVHFHHYTKGWHPTATLGGFGAAAACARLLELSEEKTAVALAIAASLASGLKANFGTMTKPLHVGHCARNGVFAALLARDGFTASDGVFEHKQGFFEVFNGAGHYDAGRILPAWADPLDIVKPGIAIKQYPCCGSTHPALDVMLQLAREHRPAADAVERIDVRIHARRLEHTNRAQPKGALDAKFSVQYCLARALLERRIGLEHFEGDAWADPAVQRLLPRIHAAPYTTAQFPAENHFGAEVRILLKDGRVLSGRTDQPLGRTSDNPLPAPLLREKFENCAGRTLPAGRIAPLCAAIQDFERLADVRTLTAIIAGQAREQAAA